MTRAAGVHLIADLACARGLGDVVVIEAALRAGAEAAGARVLAVRLHHFGPEMGVTGVALLAESHISIHTWPEEGVAAVDVFVCGADARPEAALAVIAGALKGRVTFRQDVARLGARCGAGRHDDVT